MPIETPKMSETIRRGSVEYVTATVTADVDLDMTVQIALTHGSGAHDWLPAQWVGDPAVTRQARTTSPINFDSATTPESNYGVFVKLADSPEAPILYAGVIYIN